MEDPDIKETIACEKIVDPKSTMACLDQYSLPVQAKAVFGGITKNQIKSTSCLKTEEEDDPCLRFRINA